MIVKLDSLKVVLARTVSSKFCLNPYDSFNRSQITNCQNNQKNVPFYIPLPKISVMSFFIYHRRLTIENIFTKGKYEG
jgi:hypothetical protein